MAEHLDSAWVAAGSAAVTSVATIVYLFLTYRLVRATLMSVRLTEKSIDAANRPFVGVKEVTENVSGTLDVALPTLTIVLENYGGGVSSKTGLVVLFTLEDQEHTERPDFSLSLLPKSTMSLELPFNVSVWRYARLGKKFALTINVSYQGINGKHHRYTCDYRYNSDSSIFVPSISSGD
jgi:hypothetical protein